MTNLLGCIEIFWYIEHDVSDTNKFPKFMQSVYMESLGTRTFKYPILHPNQWVIGLENIGILNLMEIPHFGRGRYVNNCIKQLLAVLHGRCFWLEEPLSIDIEIISFITDLPSNGNKPMQYLDDKNKGKGSHRGDEENIRD
jgi:hypothetical protein